MKQYEKAADDVVSAKDLMKNQLRISVSMAVRC